MSEWFNISVSGSLIILVFIIDIALKFQWITLNKGVNYKTRSSATSELSRDGDDVVYSVDDMHSALTLARPSQTDGTARVPESQELKM